jgi:hypothetical protein
VNIPTSPSYRPPAAIDPTPTCDSSISSSSSPSAFGCFLAAFFFGGASGAGAAAVAEALKPGGADASTTAS